MKSNKLQKWRESNNLTILVVAVALGLDNIILTVIVPILPAFLYDIQFSNQVFNETKANDQQFPESEAEWAKSRHNYFMYESGQVGFMLASKSIVQLMANPIVGTLTYKIGYTKPMFAGFIVMFTSTLLFAFGNSYAVLFFARAFQGIGSSCSSVAGLAMLAKTFPDDDKREKAMARAFTGLAFGVIAGPPFGGFMYQLVDKTAPFLIICFFTLIDGCLLWWTMQPNDNDEISNLKPASILALIKDPYIILISGGIFLVNIGISIIETGVPIWMLDTMNASGLELGLFQLPCTISYLLGVNIFLPVLKYTGRWLGAMISLSLFGFAFVAVSMVRSVVALLLPMAVIGIFCGVTDITLFPELGRIVDIRYSSVYGNVYSIGDFSLCLGFSIASTRAHRVDDYDLIRNLHFAWSIWPQLNMKNFAHFGPILCGLLMSNGVKFELIAITCGIVCILYSPLMRFLKNPMREDDNVEQPLIEDEALLPTRKYGSNIDVR